MLKHLQDFIERQEKEEGITIQDKIVVFGLMVILLAAAFFGKIEEKTS